MINKVKVAELLIEYGVGIDDLNDILLANGYIVLMEKLPDGHVQIIVYAKEGEKLCMDL